MKAAIWARVSTAASRQTNKFGSSWNRGARRGFKVLNDMCVVTASAWKGKQQNDLERMIRDGRRDPQELARDVAGVRAHHPSRGIPSSSAGGGGRISRSLPPRPSLSKVLPSRLRGGPGHARIGFAEARRGRGSDDLP